MRLGIFQRLPMGVILACARRVEVLLKVSMLSQPLSFLFLVFFFFFFFFLGQHAASRCNREALLVDTSRRCQS